MRSLRFSRPSAGSAPAADRFPVALPTTLHTVVVLADGDARSALESYLPELGCDKLLVVADELPPAPALADHGAAHRFAKGAGQRQDRFASAGPIDVVLDLRTTDARTKLRAFRQLFCHLRTGGLWLLDRRITTDPAEDDPFAEAMSNLSRSVGRRLPDQGDPGERRHRALARGIEGVTVTRDWFAVRKGSAHLVTVRHADATRILSRREPDLEIEVLERLPKGELVTAAPPRVHGAVSEIPQVGASIPYPEMVARRYTGRVALLDHMGAVHGTSVLPDSWRWHLAPELTSNAFTPAVEHFVETPSRLPVRELPGSWFYLDHPFPGHFGHFLTEGLTKIWAWQVAKAADPDLRLLLRHRPADRDRAEPLEARFLAAYGIARTDMVWVDEPVWVDSLVAAMPLWHNQTPYHAHPGLIAVWDRIRASLLAEATDTPTGPERVFITRPSGLQRRDCRNAPEVEALFERHGYAVVRPETLSIPAQAHLFAGARVIAGFGGSGMFNLMHSRGVEAVVLLGHEGYTARNEHLYSALIGADLHHFLSEPDEPEPDDDRSAPPGPMQHPWSFDLDRNGPELEELLSRL